MIKFVRRTALTMISLSARTSSARQARYRSGGEAACPPERDSVRFATGPACCLERKLVRNDCALSLETEPLRRASVIGFIVADPFDCPGPHCHDGDLPGFDHFCDVLDVRTDELPHALAAYLGGTTDWEGGYERSGP